MTNAHRAVHRPHAFRFPHRLAAAPWVLTVLLLSLGGCEQVVPAEDQSPSYAFPREEGGLVPLFGQDCIRAADDTYLLVYPREIERSEQAISDDLILLKSLGGKVKDSYFPELPIIAVTLPESAVSEVRKSAQLAFVSRNCTYRGQAGPLPLMPWGIDRIDQRKLPLDQIYQMPATGANVNVYVLDSGINGNHEQFGGRVNMLYTAISDMRGANDCTGHGTLMASVIGGLDYGVAKQVNLYSVRIADCSDVTDDAKIADGIRHAIKHHNAQQDLGKIQRGVINLSFATKVAGMTTSTVAAQEAVDAGLVVVGAAGNYGSDACSHFPGGKGTLMGMEKDDNIIVAGLVNEADQALTMATVNGMTMMFDYGSCIDVYAPGTNIPGAIHTDPKGTTVGTGTSLAAAHVAGVVALYLERYPKDTVKQTRTRVLQLSTPNVVKGSMLAMNPKLLSNDTTAAPRTIFLAMPTATRWVSQTGEVLKRTTFETQNLPVNVPVILSSVLAGNGNISVDDQLILSCTDIDASGNAFGSVRTYRRRYDGGACAGAIVADAPQNLTAILARNLRQRCEFSLADVCDGVVYNTRLFLNIGN